MHNLLELHKISFSQQGKQLISNISFNSKKGNTIGLVGINGAGKSTTLKIAAGILKPDSGTVHRFTSRVGYVPETPPLLDSWNVLSFLLHVCDVHGIANEQQMRAIDRVAGQCDLHTILKKSCNELSKGNQQRVAIAQALLHEPELLILDEPTSGLDPQQMRQFRHLLTNLKSEMAIIISSHIMHEITALCDKAIVIHNGQQAGELDLTNDNKYFSIIFSSPIPKSAFQNFPPWQSGHQTTHRFATNSYYNKNSIVSFCLENQFPIERVLGIADFAEDEFLALIGHRISHD